MSFYCAYNKDRISDIRSCGTDAACDCQSAPAPASALTETSRRLRTTLRMVGEMGPEGGPSDPLIEVFSGLAHEVADHLVALHAELRRLRRSQRRPRA